MDKKLGIAGLVERFADLPDGDKQKILRDNALRLFGETLDLKAI